jgi:hypothetical protein
MLRAAWRNVVRPPLSPPILVLGTAALISISVALLTATPFVRTATAADCSPAGVATRAMARHAGRPAAVAQRLDANGVFLGRGLTLPGHGAMSLPPDSFVAPPSGDALVYTASTGGRSEIHLVDLAAGCDTVVARTPGVARSATLAADGSAVYVHSVSFPARNDAGVTRYALDTGQGAQVVPPLPGDDRFGVTFATQLGWSTDGGTLFVQSCALEACRTRLLDTGSSRVTMFDSDGQGPAIGVTPDHLVTYAACGGLPCALLSTDRATGAVTTIVDQGWDAVMTTGDAGNPLVRIETAAGTTEVGQ